MMTTRASSKYFTTIVLPGGCEFLVYPPSSLKHPYYPANPRIEHAPSCKCMDEDRYMDDDSVFMSIWLSFWSIWNGKRVLAPELRQDSECRNKARDAFSLPDVRATTRAWHLPLMGNGGFKPSPRTLRPIEWFWNSLDGARDLAHCRQPDHATRFQIRFDLPRGPSWREKSPPPSSNVHLASRGSDALTAGETKAIPPRRNNNATTNNRSRTKGPENSSRPAQTSSGNNELNERDRWNVHFETFEADIMRLLGLTPDGMELNRQI